MPTPHSTVAGKAAAKEGMALCPPASAHFHSEPLLSWEQSNALKGRETDHGVYIKQTHDNRVQILLLNSNRSAKESAARPDHHPNKHSEQQNDKGQHSQSDKFGEVWVLPIVVIYWLSLHD